MGTLAYEKAKISEIQEVLTRLFPSVEGGIRYFRAAQTNMVVLGGTLENLSALESAIEALALVHPARFFVVIPDADDEDAIRAEVAAQCHLIGSHINGSKEYVCSEVIMLHVPKSQANLVPSIVRAHSISGMVTEIFLAFGTVDPSDVRLFLPQADRVLFDSEEIASATLVEQMLEGHTVRLLDLQWARLAGWREQIRGLFDRPLLNGAVRDIGTVEIVTGPTKDGALSTAAVLLGGWILERLDLAPVRRSGATFVCEPRTRVHHNAVELRIREQSGVQNGRIAEVVLAAPPTDRFSRGVQVSLRRGDAVIEATLDLDSSHRLSVPLDDESVPSLIRRTFVIGESTAKYRPALERGLELERLPNVTSPN